jgi:hypothetical protein
MAAPWSRRVHPNLSNFALPNHATLRQGISSKAVPQVLKPVHQGAVCTGAPEYAKGVTTDLLIVPPQSTPADRAAFREKRRRAVLALIRYPWKGLGFHIVFKGARLGYRAMTLTAKHRIEVYLRPGDDVTQQAYDVAHELGHAFDLKNNDEERRRKWREMRGIELSTPWFGCDACPDYGTPAGDFAETFAFLLLGPGNFHSVIAPLPTADQIPELAAFCQIEHVSESLKVRLAKENKTAKRPDTQNWASVTAQ